MEATFMRSRETDGPVWTYPNGVTVRNMRVEDSPFVGTIFTQSFRAKFERSVGKHNFEKLQQAYIEEHKNLGHRYHRIFIALVDDTPVGLAELKFCGDRPYEDSNIFRRYLSFWPLCRLHWFQRHIMSESVGRGRCYLNHIAVDANFRCKGIGKILLDVAEEVALSRCCDVIYLFVADTNRAISLYKRQGYVTVGRKTICALNYFVGVSCFIKMEKTLEKSKKSL